MALESRLSVLLLTSAATLTLVAGCESTGRPSSTKSEAKKSPAKWTAIDGGGHPLPAGDPVIDDFPEDGMELAHALAAVQGSGDWEGSTDADGPRPGNGPAAGPDVAPAPPPVMLGVRMRPIDPVLATHLGVDPRHAAVLEDVAEELNGHAGGLHDHDVIVGVEGRPQASASEIRRVLRSKKPGDTIAFTVLRAGKRQDVTVVLEPFDPARLMSATPARIGG